MGDKLIRPIEEISKLKPWEITTTEYDELEYHNALTKYGKYEEERSTKTKSELLNKMDRGGVYYHVSDESYKIGDNLYSAQELDRLGILPSWKWEHDISMGGNAVDLFNNRSEAIVFKHEYDGKILKITLPENPREHGLITNINAEKNYGVLNEIPAKYISEDYNQHKWWIEKKLQEGIYIPDRVLNHYPELKKKYSQG